MKRIVFFLLVAISVTFAQDYRRLLFMENDNSFTPKIISNLFAWYDFTDASNMVIDGSNLVSSVTDKTGGGYTLAQVVGSEQPLFSASTGVTFDGINDFLLCSNSTLNSVATIFVVATPLVVGTGTVYLVNTISPLASIQQRTNGKFTFGDVYNSSTGDLYRAVGTTDIITAVYNTTSSYIQINNNSSVAVSLTGIFGSPHYIGSYQGLSGFANIAIKAVIIYSRVLTAAEIAQVKSYLKSKYGVSY